ncbi:hypothetical protein F2Q70_00025584 [Brassica cretica]|uniref:Uncharacterized protein n=1 Tax=Brassica cretica TaxID=69181 RepID=A0A8S9LC70_BRACR|nr:hypothetical protein F2Q70_00025584 [Brassica cretica]
MESIENGDMSSTAFNRLICTLGSNNSEKEDGGGLILRPRDVIAWDEITTDILFSASRVEKMLMVYANIAVVYESLDNKIFLSEGRGCIGCVSHTEASALVGLIKPDT